MSKPSHQPFVATVSAVGLAVLAVFAVLDGADVIEQADGLLVLLAAAILVAELFPVEIPDGDGEVSFSTTFAFALLLTDGVAAVVLVHAIALAIAELVRRRPLERLVFNVAQYTICWAVAGGLLVCAHGRPARRERPAVPRAPLRARPHRLCGRRSSRSTRRSASTPPALRAGSAR